jgi:hypothetical protein
MRAESLPESTVDTMVSQWVHLNYVRAALYAAGMNGRIESLIIADMSTWTNTFITNRKGESL